MFKFVVILMSLVFLATAGPALAADSGGGSVHIPAIPERIVWDRTPITLELPVGRERIVQFDGAVKIAVPAALQDALRTQIIEGTVYWLASKPFDTQRILVREIDDGTTYLIDLAATDTTAAMPKARVINGVRSDAPKGMQTAEDAADVPKPAKPAQPDKVTLTRFAAQQLYAPQRLVPANPGIHRVPLRARKPVALFRGGGLSATPSASWRGGDLYVTAVIVRNRGSGREDLDPRDIRGRWMSATFQHGWLGAAGTVEDTTAVYLVSHQPFEEAAR